MCSFTKFLVFMIKVHTLQHISHYFLCLIKQMCEICDKNISKELKELNEIVPEKELFASMKGQLCMTKGHLGYQEGQVLL